MEKFKIEKLVNGEWTEEDYTLDIGDDFVINENNIAQEICKVGPLLFKYGELSGILTSQLRRKEELLKSLQAEVAGRIRSNAESTGEKLTENKLSEKVLQDSSVQSYLRQVHVTRDAALRTDHWWRAIVKKCDMVNALAFFARQELKNY